MGAPEDLTGKKFGRLTAIRLVGNNHNNLRLWRWRCDCGTRIDRPSAAIKAGRQVSCGCHRDEQSKARVTHGQSGTRTYRAWIGMKARCRGGDVRSKRYYADRGITVCRRWADSFEDFLHDMGECPAGMTLERIDSNAGYMPSNCTWATQAEQIRNTSRTVRVRVRGRVVCLKDACAMTGLNYDRVRSRIRSGMSPAAALWELLKC